MLGPPTRTAISRELISQEIRLEALHSVRMESRLRRTAIHTKECGIETLANKVPYSSQAQAILVRSTQKLSLAACAICSRVCCGTENTACNTSSTGLAGVEPTNSWPSFTPTENANPLCLIASGSSYPIAIYNCSTRAEWNAP